MRTFRRFWPALGRAMVTTVIDYLWLVVAMVVMPFKVIYDNVMEFWQDWGEPESPKDIIQRHMDGGLGESLARMRADLDCRMLLAGLPIEADVVNDHDPDGDNYEDDEEECCPKCDGDVGCNADGTWQCVQGYGYEIGCGWRGHETGARPNNVSTMSDKSANDEDPK